MLGEGRAFWYRAVDYKAAEADLNAQAARGLKLAGVNLWGRAQWETAQEPLQYAVLLCEPNRRAEGQKVMEMVGRQLQDTPWKQVAAWGPMQVLESPKGTESPFPNPLEELVFAKEQYFKGQKTGLLVMAGMVLLLLAFLAALATWRNLLSSNLLVCGLLLAPLIMLYVWAELRQNRQYLNLARAAAEAGEGLPVPGPEEARRRWRRQAWLVAALAVVLAATLRGDMGRKETGQLIWQLAATIALGYTISLYHSRGPGRTPWYLVAGGATAIALFLGFWPGYRAQTPPSAAEAAALPVLSGMLGEDPYRVVRDSGATFLGETYSYWESQDGSQLTSVYCRAAFPALADKLYEEALGAFHKRNDMIYAGEAMRPCGLPGFDRAARGEAGGSLALQRGLEVVWVGYDPARFTEAEILAAVEEKMLR